MSVSVGQVLTIPSPKRDQCRPTAFIYYETTPVHPCAREVGLNPGKPRNVIFLSNYIPRYPGQATPHRSTDIYLLWSLISGHVEKRIESQTVVSRPASIKVTRSHQLAQYPRRLVDHVAETEFILLGFLLSFSQDGGCQIIDLRDGNKFTPVLRCPSPRQYDLSSSVEPKYTADGRAKLGMPRKPCPWSSDSRRSGIIISGLAFALNLASHCLTSHLSDGPPNV